MDRKIYIPLANLWKGATHLLSQKGETGTKGEQTPFSPLVPDPSSLARRGTDFVACAVLVLCALGLHGHGLTLGFWFDDHTHLELSRQHGFENLASGNRFDWNGRIAHAWWAKKETGWAYFRPVPVAMRTGLWQLFGLNPVPFHVVHLSLFSLSVVLLFGLLRRCGWGPVTALIAGLFFVLHPANAFTTPWLANDGPVLVGLWMVSALWLFHVSAQSDHRRPAILAGVFLCYALAMLSRESGIVLGPLLVLFDWLGRAMRGAGRGTRDEARTSDEGRGASEGHHPSLLSRLSPLTSRPLSLLSRLSPLTSRPLLIYVGLALEGVVYLLGRALCLGETPMPRSPYVHWPSEPGFYAWLPYKFLNELVCLPLGLPFVPIVEVPWWQARPLVTAVGVLLVAALAVAFLIPLRRSRVMWGVLGGIALAQAPTALVFCAPYNYYLATAGWAVLLATWARHFWATRPRLVSATTGALAVWYLAGLWAGSWMLHSAATAERLVRADVMATRPEEYPQGTRLFFINMPFFAVEVAPSLRLATDRPDLEVYPLTFAPQLFFPKTEIYVEQEDDHTFLVRCAGPALFSDDFGDLVQLGWFGASRRDLSVGPVSAAPEAGPMPFRVEVMRGDRQGVYALRFVFDQPLDDPRQRFFLGSPEALAREIRFHKRGPIHQLDAVGAGSDEFPPVTGTELRDSTPIEDRDFDRLRRMQISADRCFNLLSGEW